MKEIHSFAPRSRQTDTLIAVDHLYWILQIQQITIFNGRRNIVKENIADSNMYIVTIKRFLIRQAYYVC